MPGAATLPALTLKGVTTLNADFVNASKMAILLASLCAGVFGFLRLRFSAGQARGFAEHEEE